MDITRIFFPHYLVSPHSPRIPSPCSDGPYGPGAFAPDAVRQHIIPTMMAWDVGGWDSSIGYSKMDGL